MNKFVAGLFTGFLAMLGYLALTIIPVYRAIPNPAYHWYAPWRPSQIAETSPLFVAIAIAVMVLLSSSSVALWLGIRELCVSKAAAEAKLKKAKKAEVEEETEEEEAEEEQPKKEAKKEKAEAKKEEPSKETSKSEGAKA